MRKSILKRFRITRQGKILRRRAGINHYLAKKPGRTARRKRKTVSLSAPELKNIRKLIG